MTKQDQDLVPDQLSEDNNKKPKKAKKAKKSKKVKQPNKDGSNKNLFIEYFKQYLWVKIVAVIVLVLLITVVIKMCGKSSDNTYLTVTDKLISQPVGSFRYVLDVRTNKHTDKSKEQSDDVSDIADLEKIEANVDVDKVLEEYQQADKEFVSWSNKEGVEVVNWDYPKYKIILEGNVKSVAPLEMNMSLSLATNYFNDALTDIVVKDGKTYVNIEQLRYWLLSSKDESLIHLGESLPESAKYVEYEGDAFNLYSTFAENSEIDLTRESDLVNMFKRFLIVMKTTVPRLSISSDCLTNDSGIYKLNITGDNSVALLKSIKSMSLGVGDYYKGLIATQYKNKLLTEEQYKQAQKQVDNVSSAFTNFNTKLGVLDLSKLDLRVSGNARTYTGGKGADVYESSLAFQFSTESTDYSIALQLSKSSSVSDVKVPSESTTSIDSFNDKDFVEKSLLQVFNYLNITGIDLEKQLEITPTSLKSDLVKGFVKLVNEVNSDDEDFRNITESTLSDYIDTYRNFEVKDGSSELDILNATLVSDFLKEFEVFIPSEKSQSPENSGVLDDSRFSSVVYENDDFRIYADFDKASSNTRCVQVKCYILNKTNKKLKLNTSDFTLQTMLSSKYPANYESLLEEYDNEFDMSKAPSIIEVDANGYTETSLYFVIANGLEYMDMWYQGEKLGVVVNR